MSTNQQKGQVLWPFFFGVADDAALCAGDVELIEIEGPILRLEMQGAHPSK